MKPKNSPTKVSKPSRATLKNCELFLGNANRRFSGVTSTMLQNYAFQKNIIPTLIMGCHHHVDDKHACVSFWRIALHSRGLVEGRWRIFHARRNNEVVLAFILKYICRVKIKVVFTSTAQRQHSRFTKWLIRRVDGLLSTCTAAASYLERKPDQIIAHGIRADQYVPANEKNKHTYFNKWEIKTPYVCGIFGRVRDQKGVHLFVRACIENFKNNNKFTALIVGAIKPQNEKFVAQLQDEINRAGFEDRIRFLGEQPFENLPELFSIMNIVCALSKTEGFGLTVLEAMSSEAAVIATRAGAWPDIIQHDVNGLLVDTENQMQVNEALNTLMSNKNKMIRFGIGGRADILEHYLVGFESEKLCAYFRSLQ